MATKPKSKRVGDAVFPAPIKRQTRGLALLGYPGMTPADDEVSDTKAERLVGLAQAYGIDLTDSNCWLLLCMRLANDYVRGFRVINEKQRVPGRPLKDKARLTTPAVAARVAQGMPVRRACHEVATETGENPGTIETRYYNDLRKTPAGMERKRRGRGGAQP